MILEPSNYDFRTLRTEKTLENISKISHFQCLHTEKHGFVHDRMILEPSNYDFEVFAPKNP